MALNKHKQIYRDIIATLQNRNVSIRHEKIYISKGRNKLGPS